MKYALFIAEKPKKPSHDQGVAWNNFLGYVEQTLGNDLKNAYLSEGIYLLPLENGLHKLGLLVHHAKDLGFHSRTLFFDQEPEWVYDKS
jgi:hypothetical protein